LADTPILFVVSELSVEEVISEAEAFLRNGNPARARKACDDILRRRIVELLDEAPADLAARACMVFDAVGDPGTGLALVWLVQRAAVHSYLPELALIKLAEGMCLESLDALDDAIESYSTAVRWFSVLTKDNQAGAARHQAEARARLGRSHMKNGNFVRAEGHLRPALALTHTHGLDERLRSKIRAYLAVTLAEMGIVEPSEGYFQQALQSFRGLGMWREHAMTEIDHSICTLTMYENPLHRSRSSLRQALSEAVQALMYLETARVSFGSFRERRDWEVFTAKGWNVAFDLADELHDASVIAELIEARINATKHTAPVDEPASPSPSLTNTSRRSVDTAEPERMDGEPTAIGGAMLISGHRLTAAAPPPLLLPATRGPRTVLQQALISSPYPGALSSRAPVRTW
jgi:tetratricopeptide (TPR) repeat protein